MEVKLHEYKEGTPNQKRYFIELWDVGGSQSHLNTRTVFYHPTNGTRVVGIALFLLSPPKYAAACSAKFIVVHLLKQESFSFTT